MRNAADTRAPETQSQCRPRHSRYAPSFFFDLPFDAVRDCGMEACLATYVTPSRDGCLRRNWNRKPPGRCVSSSGVSRRRLLSDSLLFGAVVSLAPPSTADALKDSKLGRFVKLDSGVKYEDVLDGEGAEASEGNLVEINYVCRRSNGYFVHSTVDQFSGESNPVVILLDEKEVIKGLKEVLVGMKVGGKRRALIPPNVGYVSEKLKPIPDEFGPRRSLLSHADEPLVFEVQLLKVVA